MTTTRRNRELKALTNGWVGGPTILGIPSRTRSGAVYKASAHEATTPPPAQIITLAQTQPPRQQGLRSGCDLAALPQSAIQSIMQGLDLASKRELRLCSVALKQVVSQEVDSLAFDVGELHMAGRAFTAARLAIITCVGAGDRFPCFPSLAQCVRDGFFTNLRSLRVDHMSRVSVKSLGRLTSLVSLDLSM